MSEPTSAKSKLVPIRLQPTQVSPNVMSNSKKILSPSETVFKRPNFLPFKNEDLKCLSGKKTVRKKLGFDRLSSGYKPEAPKLSFVPNQRKTSFSRRTSNAIPSSRSKYVSDLSDISEGISELDISRTSFGKVAPKSDKRSLLVNKFNVRNSSVPRSSISKRDMSTQYDISENTRGIDASTQSELPEIPTNYNQVLSNLTNCCETVLPAVISEAECDVAENFENHIQSFIVHKPSVKDTVLQELNIHESCKVQNLKNIGESGYVVNSYDEEDQNASFLQWEAYANSGTPTHKDILDTFNELKDLLTECNKKFDYLAKYFNKMENIEKNKENINANSQPNVLKTPKTDSKSDLRKRVLMLNNINATPHTQSKSTKKWGNSLMAYSNMKHQLRALQTPVIDKSQSKITFSKTNSDTSYKVLNQIGFLTKTPEDEE